MIFVISCTGRLKNASKTRVLVFELVKVGSAGTLDVTVWIYEEHHSGLTVHLK